MTRTAARTKPKLIATRSGSVSNQVRKRVEDAVRIADAYGLLKGSRTAVVRGRMPAPLVAQAKKRTGIRSDSKLLEAALATIAVADDYGEWLISQRNTIGQDLDLEF